MQPVKFAVIGNPVVDGLSHVTENQLESFGLHKGDANTVTHSAMVHIGAEVAVEQFQSGGSAANLAYTLSQLGHPVCFMGPLGSDSAGKHFFSDMVSSGVTVNVSNPNYRTLELFILVTPDGTRTMVQPQPAPPSPDDTWLDETLLSGAQWVLLEGYAVRDWPVAMAQAHQQARASGAHIALQLPAPHACRQAAPALAARINEGVDLLLGNEQEYIALIQATSNETHRDMHTRLQNTPRVITRSGESAEFISATGASIKEAPPARLSPQDNTGAGDAFAAGFLAVYAAGGNSAMALRRGHLLGAAAIQHVGPRIPNPHAVWFSAPHMVPESSE